MAGGGALKELLKRQKLMIRGKIIQPGDKVTTSRGEEYIFDSIQRYNEQAIGGNSSGKIVLRDPTVKEGEPFSTVVYYPSVVGGKLLDPTTTLKRVKKRGGRIHKAKGGKISRRDLLKGLGAGALAAGAGAAGLGKTAVKTGALETVPAAAIKTALKRKPTISKSWFSEADWKIINRHMTRYIDELKEDLASRNPDIDEFPAVMADELDTLQRIQQLDPSVSMDPYDEKYFYNFLEDVTGSLEEDIGNLDLSYRQTIGPVRKKHGNVETVMHDYTRIEDVLGEIDEFHMRRDLYDAENLPTNRDEFVGQLLDRRQEVHKKRGGKIRKAKGGKISRRDLLKGLGAGALAAGAGAAGLGKTAVKTGALDAVEPAAIKAALNKPRVHRIAKGWFEDHEWSRINKYLNAYRETLRQDIIGRNPNVDDFPEVLVDEMNTIQRIQALPRDAEFDRYDDQYLRSFLEDQLAEIEDTVGSSGVRQDQEYRMLDGILDDWEEEFFFQQEIPVEKAGGGAIKKAFQSKYKAGPGLHDAAMKAVAEGDATKALEYLDQLQELLELSDEDFSKMLGAQFDRGPRSGKFVPPVEPDLDTPVGGYKNKPKVGMAEGGTPPKGPKGALFRAAELFAKRQGKVKSPDIEIPQGFDSFYTKQYPDRVDIIGVRKDGKEEIVDNIGPGFGNLDSMVLAKELASIYNTGGFSNAYVARPKLQDLFPPEPPPPPKASVTQIRGGQRAPEGNRLRSFQEHLHNLTRTGDVGADELEDLADVARENLSPEDLEIFLEQYDGDGLIIEYQGTRQVPYEPDVTIQMGGGEGDDLRKILAEMGLSPDDMRDPIAAFRRLQSGEMETRPASYKRRLTYEEHLMETPPARMTLDELEDAFDLDFMDEDDYTFFQEAYVDLEDDMTNLLMDYHPGGQLSGEINDIEIFPNPRKENEIFAKVRYRGDADLYYFRIFEDDVTEIGGPDDIPPRFAEGGEVKKDDKTAMDYLRLVGQSLFGAVPFGGEELPLIGADVGEQIYKKAAYPLAGLASQWYGVNPTTDQFEYAGPGSDMIYGRGRPSYPDDELLSYDPAEHRRQYEAWRDWKDPGETGSIPGIIDETALLPAMPQMIEMMTDMDEIETNPDYEPSIGAPEWSLEASDRAAENWERSLAKFGLPEPQGFVENALMAGGMMVGQIPVPVAWLGRLRALFPGAKSTIEMVEKAGRFGWLKAAAGSAPEFLFPTIDPKTANYVTASLFGGGLMTLLAPGEEVPEDVPPDIASLIQRHNQGDEEATKLLQEILDNHNKEQERDAQLMEMYESIGRSGMFAGGGAVKNSVEKLRALGDAQRGAPEQAMLDIQRTMGGGVLNVVSEHVGDIIHRMSHHAEYDTAYPYLVQDKVRKGLSYLEHPYGFEREMKENLQATSDYYGRPLGELELELDENLSRYADEHRKLPVYNRPHYWARKASVAVGEKDWGTAIKALHKLQDLLDLGDDEFNNLALKVVSKEGLAGGGAVRKALQKKFVIWDTKEQKAVGQPYSNKKRARTRVDKLDNEYGAYRYQVKTLDEDGEMSRFAGGGKVRQALNKFRISPNMADELEHLEIATIDPEHSDPERIAFAQEIEQQLIAQAGKKRITLNLSDETMNYLLNKSLPNMMDIWHDNDKTMLMKQGARILERQKLKKAKGGKISRRDLLKGLGAGAVAAGATAAGLGKMATKQDVLPVAAIKEALAPAVKVPNLSTGEALRRVADTLNWQAQELFDLAKMKSPETRVADWEDFDEFEMLKNDSADYSYIAEKMEAGEYEEAVKRYDSLDTASREYIYDHLDQADLEEVRTALTKAGSNYESMPVSRHPDYQKIARELDQIDENSSPEQVSRAKKLMRELIDNDYDVEESWELAINRHSAKRRPKAGGGRIRSALGNSAVIGEKTYTPQRVDKGNKLVMVDAKALDQLWSQNKDNYVSTEGKNQIGKRIEQFKKYLAENDEISVGSVYYDKKGGLSFGDGRHRARVMIDSGMEEIPISMEPKQIEALQAELDSLKPNKAGGGRITRSQLLEMAKGGKISRRDLLKGLGAAGVAGVAGAAGVGKIATKTGAIPEVPAAAIKKALEPSRVRDLATSVRKSDFSPVEWRRIEEWIDMWVEDWNLDAATEASRIGPGRDAYGAGTIQGWADRLKGIKTLEPDAEFNPEQKYALMDMLEEIEENSAHTSGEGNPDWIELEEDYDFTNRLNAEFHTPVSFRIEAWKNALKVVPNPSPRVREIFDDLVHDARVFEDRMEYSLEDIGFSEGAMPGEAALFERLSKEEAMDLQKMIHASSDGTFTHF